jgi:hypothetical protein
VPYETGKYSATIDSAVSSVLDVNKNAECLSMVHVSGKHESVGKETLVVLEVVKS